MKTLIVLIAVTFSINSFAQQPSYQSTLGMGAASGILTSTTSGIKPFGKAEAVIRDANEYYMNGTITIYLAEQIQNIQAENDVSADEAIDMLVETSKEILSLNY